MKTYIALLRGINVSGQKIIKMNDLAKMAEKLGFTNVKTYLQSGNVIFQATDSLTENYGLLIQNQISSEFGFNVPVFVYTSEQIQNILVRNPFANDPLVEDSALYITFLSELPLPYNFGTILNKTGGNEKNFITGKTVYLFCPDGYGKTKLNNTFLEKTLGVTATTRNWKTTNELLKLANQISSYK